MSPLPLSFERVVFDVSVQQTPDLASPIQFHPPKPLLDVAVIQNCEAEVQHCEGVEVQYLLS